MKHFWTHSFFRFVYKGREMPRKFRLGRHRKNEFKRKSDCTLVVEHVPIVMASVPVSAGGQETLVAQDYDLTEPLVVSLPLEVVLNAAASSLDMMRTTIRTLSVLPPGTVLTSPHYLF